jgi:hypothetical protein
VRTCILECYCSGIDLDRLIKAHDDTDVCGARIHIEPAPVSPTRLAHVDDNEHRPIERGIDELHPRSSRTLYVGNLDRRVHENWVKVCAHVRAVVARCICRNASLTTVKLLTLR